MNYFDLHCDTAYRCFDENLEFSSKQLAVNSFSSDNFKIYKQCFAIFIKDALDSPFEYYKKCLSSFKEKLLQYPTDIIPIFTVEGGKVIEHDISRTYQLYLDGIKAVSLVWNGETELAGGADTDIPLKPLGYKFIRELNIYGIACDVSHLSRSGFTAAVENADKVFASHSCFDSVNPHRRNLTDSQALQLKEKGGIIGLCLYPVFLGGDDVFDSVYRHITHALELGLEDNLSIGSDFDGADMCEKIKSPADIVKLNEYLARRGIGNDILNKIFYSNADNFFASL